MTTVRIVPIFPGPIPESRFAHNRDLPSTSGIRRAAKAFNYASGFQRKLLFAKCYGIQETPAGSASATNIYFNFRTGENVGEIFIGLGLVPADNAAATAPYVQLTIHDGSTATSTRKIYHNNYDNSGSYAPSQIGWRFERITTDDGLLSDTVYRGALAQLQYCRVHSIVVWEKSEPAMVTSVTGVTDSRIWEAQSPILDANVQGLLETGTELWRHNASPLIAWSQESAAVPKTTTSSQYRNVLDSSTARTSSTAGWVINNQYHDTFGDGGTVPVQLCFYAQRVSGAGNMGIRMVDSSGTVFTTTISASSSLPGDTYTTTISAYAGEKVDFQWASLDGSSQWRLYCFSLWEYEA